MSLFFILHGILLKHKRRWNTTISDNMNESWDYHAKQNKSDRKSQEWYDFTHMWDIKPKAANEQIRQANKKHSKTQTTVWWLPERNRVGCAW